MLLDYDEFDKMCDRGVLKLVDDVKYHSCFTVNCKQIFEVERTKSEGNIFDCGVCNLSYCYLCKDTEHRPYTCEQLKKMKNSNLTDAEL